MNVAAARAIVQYGARFARDPSYYDLVRIDTAIQAAGDELIRRCQLLPVTGNVTLTAGSAAIPTFPTGGSGLIFRPDRLINAYLSGANVTINGAGYLAPSAPFDTVGAPAFSALGPPSSTKLANIPFVTLSDAQIGQPQSGQPQAVAFDTTTTGQVYPTPDKNYTLNFQWSDLFTTWSPGGSGSTTINLPDDLLRPALYYGAVLYLQFNETADNATIAVTRERWENAIQELSGKNSLFQTVLAAGTGGEYRGGAY